MSKSCIICEFMKWKSINLPAGRQARNDRQTTRLYGQTFINETKAFDV